MSLAEYNFDGLIGHTHNYSGLSFGNIASKNNQLSLSNPRQAALEGLEKMAYLYALGVPQALLPPHERPHIKSLRRLGFSGSDADILSDVAKLAPHLLTKTASASAMWTANAATVSPSADTHDSRVHLTPANLISMPHRALETPVTTRILRSIFSDETAFMVHDALPAHAVFGDEGAANHTRLFAGDQAEAVELFVYGQAQGSSLRPQKYPARQTLEASMAVARLHGLAPQRTLFLQQNPDAIDAGAFHNDVVCVGNGNVLFFHEKAFIDHQDLMKLKSSFEPHEFHLIEVSEADVPLDIAIKSYLFNSQLLSVPHKNDQNAMLLIAPSECQDQPRLLDYLHKMIAADNPIKDVAFVDVRQSMRNGGGPACLRLRVALDASETSAIKANVFFNNDLHQTLKSWVNQHYRDRLTPHDLTDHQLLIEGRQALDELTQILRLGSVYDFQKA